MNPPEQQSQPGTLSRIGRNAAWLLVGEAVAKLALLAIAFLVARNLGAAAMGSFTLGYAATLLLVVLTAVGQVEVLMRAVATTPSQAGALLRRSERLQARGTGIALPLAIIALLLLPDPTLRWTLAGFLPYALLRTRLFTRGGLFKGLDRAHVDVQARAIEMVTALLLILGVTALGSPVWWCGPALAAGAALALLWLRPKVAALGTEPPAPASLLRNGLFTDSLPFLGISLATQLLLRADTFLLEAFAVARSEIGVYGIAGTLVWGALTLPQLLALAAYPTLSRSAAAGSSPRRAALLVTAIGLTAGGAVTLLLQLLAQPITHLAFTDPPANARQILATLAWALPAASVSLLLGIVLASWHRQRAALVCQGLALLTALGLNLLWIPRLGALGAARAAIAAQLVLAAGQFLVAMGALRASKD